MMCCCTVRKCLMLAAVLMPLGLSLAAEYRGIHVGQDAADLPQTLRGDSVWREGYLQGTWVRIVLLNGKVYLLDVVYSGKISPDKVTSQKVTLAQAMKLHSLTEQAAPPQFGYAVDRAGKTYGLADLRNAIVYRTPFMAADSLVATVTYLDASTPVLQTANDHPLDSDISGQLLSAARAAILPPALRW
jgi:hypothetical protein